MISEDFFFVQSNSSKPCKFCLPLLNGEGVSDREKKGKIKKNDKKENREAGPGKYLEKSTE